MRWARRPMTHARFARGWCLRRRFLVQLGLKGFDLDQRDSACLTPKAENIRAKGFQAVISTGASTRVFAVAFNWLAIGA